MIKTAKTEPITNSAVKMTIEVSSEKTRDTFNEIISKYKASIQYPGFRKGKVPENLIMRKIGVDIKKETAAKIMEEASEQVLKDVNPEPISQPQLIDFPELEPGKPYIFYLTYDVYPEVEIPDYSELEFEAPEIIIGKKHIDDQIEIIRRNNSTVQISSKDEVENNSIVDMDYVELDNKGSPLYKTEYKNFVLDMESKRHPYEIDEDILGMKVGEMTVFDKKLNDRDVKIQVTINKISERKFPEPDDELAQDVSEDFKTIKDLKKALERKLRENVDFLLRKFKTDSILLKIYEKTDIQIPVSMLEREYRSILTQEEKDPENYDGNDKDHLKSLAKVRLGIKLLCQKIIEKEKIEVSADELETELKERFGNPDENFNEATESEKTRIRRYFETSLEEEMYKEKLFSYLLNSVSINQGKKMDYDEFLLHIANMPNTGII